MRMIFRSSLLVLGGLSAGVLSCSNFILPTSDDGAVISGRTMDLGWYVIGHIYTHACAHA